MWDRRDILAVAVVLAVATTALGLSAADRSLEQPAPIGPQLAETLDERDGQVPVMVTVAGDAPGLREAAQAHGLDVRYAFEHIPVIAGTIDGADVGELALQPWVTEIIKDRPVRPLLDVSRVETMAPQANAEGYGGDGINVAVVDTGIDRTHPALDGRVTGCVTFQAGVQLPTCQDDEGHGTHVAGILGAQPTEDRPDVVGVAPNVTFSAVKTLNAAGVGLSSDTVAGMEWVIENKDRYNISVMSVSIGSGWCRDGDSTKSQMVDKAVANGIVAVVGAGNSGPNECTIASPGAAREAITVGNVQDLYTRNYGDDRIDFDSSRGPTADGRIKPDVVAPGEDITSTYLGGTYTERSGTSMATPHVSGVVAAMLDREPGLTPDEVKQRIHDTGIQLASSPWDKPNNHTGWGFINTCALLELSDCTQPFDLTEIHAGNVTMNWWHETTGGHNIEALVPVVAGEGSVGNGEVTVKATFTDPGGGEHEEQSETEGDGTADLLVQTDSGGHGLWEACVTTMWGSGYQYNATQNVDDCETLDVSH